MPIFIDRRLNPKDKSLASATGNASCGERAKT